jgi:hypothetical protein
MFEDGVNNNAYNRDVPFVMVVVFVVLVGVKSIFTERKCSAHARICRRKDEKSHLSNGDRRYFSLTWSDVLL